MSRAGSVRAADSWSSTEMRTLQYSHMWIVKGFSLCEARFLETSVVIKDVAYQKPECSSAEIAPTTFKLRLHPQGNKESNKDFCFFQVFTNTTIPKFKAKFSVFNVRGEEVAATVYTGSQQLNGYFEYIRRDTLIQHIQPQDEIQLMLHLVITMDMVTKCSQSAPNEALPGPRTIELAKNLESIFQSDRHTDFKIICRAGKESRSILTHKVILSARSPVFAAMLARHTDEMKTNQVIYDDIDYEVMLEMLFYIYSGRCPSIQRMSLELLAVADRFQLSGLKEMADQVLRTALTAENVCRTLVLADMHNSTDLKEDALNFIANNSNDVIETDGWAVMVQEHPRLVTDVVAAMSLAQDHPSRGSSTSFIEPPPKRLRYIEHSSRHD